MDEYERVNLGIAPEHWRRKRSWPRILGDLIFGLIFWTLISPILLFQVCKEALVALRRKST